MTEKRLLSNILTQGILLLTLGLCLLILPKVSHISFGFMLYFAYILYGGYKIINSFLLRNFSKHFILDIFVGFTLFLSGILLCIAQITNITLIVSLVGIYFLLESLSYTAFGIQTRNLMYNMWILNYITSFLQFIFGLVVIVILPAAALWFVGLISAINFIIIGVTLNIIYWGTVYTR